MMVRRPMEEIEKVGVSISDVGFRMSEESRLSIHSCLPACRHSSIQSFSHWWWVGQAGEAGEAGYMRVATLKAQAKAVSLRR